MSSLRPSPIYDCDAGLELGTFDAGTAQKLGLVANELVTNAFQHGAPSIAANGGPTRAEVVFPA